MASPEATIPKHRSNYTTCIQKSSSAAFSIVPTDPLAMDIFNNTLLPISDLHDASFFASKQKSDEVRNHPAGSNHNSSRTGHPIKGTSLVGGYAPETDCISTIQRQELALLEQVLHKKDGTSAPSSSYTVQARSETKSMPCLLEPELLFSDILGDHGTPPQPLTIKSGDHDEEPPAFRCMAMNRSSSKHVQENEKLAEPQFPSQNSILDLDVSGALASIGYADSREAREVEGGQQVMNSHQVTFSNVTREQENEDTHTPNKNSGSSKNSILSPANSFALADLQKVAGLNPNAKEKTRRYSEIRDFRTHRSDRLETETENPLLIARQQMTFDDAAYSPISDSSMSGAGTHPDLYENLGLIERKLVDSLKGKISFMPRRKLRESLAKYVSIEEVEPLMSVNRDELAGMLGLGVTTWKMFVHHTLGVPRWPARALKSQKVKEKKLLQKKAEAEASGEYVVAERVEKELARLKQAHMKRRKLFRRDGRIAISNSGISKK